MVPETKVVALTLLSDQLSAELVCAVKYSCLQGHPIFEMCMNQHHLMQALAKTALSQKTFAENERVAVYRARSSHMIMVTAGQLRYVSAQGNTMVMKRGDWLFEACLWANWICIPFWEGWIDGFHSIAVCHVP